MRQHFQIILLFTGLFIGGSTPIWAQYHYIEPTILGGMLGKNGLDFIISGQLNYCFHISPTHAIGARIAYNRMPLYQNHAFYYTAPYYDVYPRYRNFAFGTAGLFYRAYINEMYFVEAAFSGGSWHETFEAHREPVTNLSPNISAVNVKSDLRYPILNLETNIGMQFNIDKHINFIYKTGPNLFFLKPPVSSYLQTKSTPSSSFTFYPTDGTYFFMHMTLCLGLKF